jgi:hypothetical protein
MKGEHRRHRGPATQALATGFVLLVSLGRAHAAPFDPIHNGSDWETCLSSGVAPMEPDRSGVGHSSAEFSG